jgi:ABC-type antimicrobial peptide transport system permease subunit
LFRIPLLQGRTWTEAETSRPANVVVINDVMARQFWPNGDAIGQKIRMPGLRPGQFIRTAPTSTDWLEVIGVVKAIRNRGLHDPPAPAAYVPYTLFLADNFALIMRTRSSPLSVVRAVRERINRVAAGQPIGPAKSSVRTGEDILRATGWGREEFVSSLFAAFAALGLALATIGLYSAVSYATASRSQEFGIRMALGARKADVVRLVLRPAILTVAAGSTAGLLLAFSSSRLLTHWTIAPAIDASVVPLILLVLFAAAAIATVVPARQAADADPMVTLRGD